MRDQPPGRTFCERLCASGTSAAAHTSALIPALRKASAKDRQRVRWPKPISAPHSVRMRTKSDTDGIRMKQLVLQLAHAPVVFRVDVLDAGGGQLNRPRVLGEDPAGLQKAVNPQPVELAAIVKRKRQVLRPL